jgi:hypothetical protein
LKISFLHAGKMQTSDRSQSVQTNAPAFTLDVHDFTELMQLRGHEACERVKRHFGGVDKLCELLHVSPNEGTFSLHCFFVVCLFYGANPTGLLPVVCVAHTLLIDIGY